MRLQLRLLLETALLTLLIWTYADQASYETCTAVLAVRVATPPDMVARIEEARGGTAEVVYVPMKLRGPKAAVRKLDMESGSGASIFTLNLSVPPEGGSQGSTTRDIRDDVARLPTIRDRGLQVEEVSRPMITFTLDRYKAIKLNVDTDAGKFTDALDGKPIIEPNGVTVKVLESELAGRDKPEPRLVIPIEEQIRTRAEEVAATFSVPLGSKWEGMDAKFVPEEVRVTVRLAKSYQTVELSLIPLRVLWPPGAAGGDFEIEWQDKADTIQNISVRIPVGKSRALDSKDVLAFVPFEKSDFPNDPSPTDATSKPAATEGWSQREVRFIFPQGFGDVQVDGQRQVKFRIKKRANTETLPPRSDLP